jgi:hypothetical protein
VNNPRFLAQRNLCLRSAVASRPVGRDGAFEVVHPSDVLDDGYATIVPDVSPSAKTGLTDKIATGVADYLEGKTDRDIRRGPNNLHVPEHLCLASSSMKLAARIR